MKFITAIYFNEEKKNFVRYEANPADNAIEASKFSESLANEMPKFCKAKYKTFELGARNWI